VVTHDGQETTCRDGHFCYVRGEHNEDIADEHDQDNCTCVQKYASRPNEDRCWVDVNTPNSVRACHRLCISSNGSETAACQMAADNFNPAVHDEAPNLELCWDPSSPIVVNDAGRCTAGGVCSNAGTKRCTSDHDCGWELCKSRARDEIDGDVTQNIAYKLKKGDEWLCGTETTDCSYGAVKYRFTTHDETHTVDNLFGELENGDYDLMVRVCDSHRRHDEGERAPLCHPTDGWLHQQIVIDLPAQSS